MTKDELIVRLTRELYDLKETIEYVRINTDAIYDESSSDTLFTIRMHSINILNKIDTFEDYYEN